MGSVVIVWAASVGIRRPWRPLAVLLAGILAAIAEVAAGMNDGLQKMAAQLGQLGEAMADAMRKTGEEWPPQRILAAAVDEYNRRMAEFNHRGDPDS